MSLLPADFDCQHYRILNHCYTFKSTEKEALEEHYILHSTEEKLPHNFNNIDIIIYSGGKTGSSTLYHSFKGVIGSERLFAVHNDFQLGGSVKIADIFRQRKKKPVLIVSAYREPVSRHLSSFFQNIFMHLNTDLDHLLKMDIKFIMDELIRIMRNNFFELYHPFLENDKKNINGIDIFKTPFNKEKGFQVYRTPKVKLILLLFDKINNWGTIIRDNTQYKKFQLMPANLTNNKETYSLYREVCDKIIIPTDLLDCLFLAEKTNMEYFYTPEQIDQIKKKWYRGG